MWDIVQQPILMANTIIFWTVLLYTLFGVALLVSGVYVSNLMPLRS